MLAFVASDILTTFFTFVPAVNQLQQTLVSIQELLVQQQQKIQELSRELSAAEVTTLNHLNTLKQL